MFKSPFQLTVFVLIPQLPCVNHVLPYNVGARSYGGGGVKEGHRKPYTNHGVLLSEGLSGTNALAITAAYALAYAEEQQGYAQRKDEKKDKTEARHGGCNDIV